ncbi:MAG: hypothetical protein IJZ85_06410 [Lachnospiraceae bacterium]|nr:hypothetical protein [Lachnospiraceae bacterium]
MTAEEAHREAAELAEMAKDRSLWGPELFDRVAANPALSPCVFNRIRQALGPEEWKEFDHAYCGYKRPQDKELVDWIERKAGEEAWERSLQQMSSSELIRLLENLANGDSLQQKTA